MTIRNVTHAAIPTTTIGGAGAGNSYNYKVSREIECGAKGSGVWSAITTLSHGERDVAACYRDAGQPVPAELEGPYDGYGRNQK